MTGKRYYLTTLDAWRRHAHRFTNSHFITLAQAHPAVNERAASADSSARDAVLLGKENCLASSVTGTDDTFIAPGAAGASGEVAASAGATPILVLVEGDEGAHLALDDDPAFEALPHPLAQKPISGAAQAALAPHGVAPGATTFDAAEALARVHPLLRHRVF